MLGLNECWSGQKSVPVPQAGVLPSRVPTSSLTRVSSVSWVVSPAKWAGRDVGREGCGHSWRTEEGRPVTSRLLKLAQSAKKPRKRLCGGRGWRQVEGGDVCVPPRSQRGRIGRTF